MYVGEAERGGVVGGLRRKREGVDVRVQGWGGEGYVGRKTIK